MFSTLGALIILVAYTCYDIYSLMGPKTLF